MTTKQSVLTEKMLTQTWPQGHKMKKEKSWRRTWDSKEQKFESIIEKIEELGRDTFIVATSGGKDSGVVLDKLNQLNKVSSVFYIRTNTGVQMTEDFVKDRCQELGLKLDIRPPTQHPYVYVAICLQFGFPGPPLHDFLMKELKYRTMLKFVVEPQFKGKKPILMTGVRKFESDRRKFNYNHPINQDTTSLWFGNPIFYESTEEVYRYYLENDVKRSPVYDHYPSSLECGCGTFAHGKAEMDAIKKLDPNREEFFKWLTIGVKKFGSEFAKRHTKWGGYDWTDEEVQHVLTEFLGTDKQHTEDISQLICGSECGPSTMRDMVDF